MERSLTNRLKQLHHLHLQLKDVQDHLERGPRQLKARQQLILQKQADLDEQRQKQKALKMAADQKSLQLKSNEAKIHELKAKLNAASSNREFDIIKKQIEADTVANSVLEDEILESLEKVDAGQIAARQIESELATAKAEETRFAADVAAAEMGLQTRAAELKAALAEAESHLPNEASIVYRRLVLAHGAGALAAIEGTNCSCCYVNIPPQMLLGLRSGQLMFCKTCGRLLYPGDA